MATATNGNVRIHWDEQGDGTPLLLVMGAAYSSRMWYPAIPDLSAKHRVLWFDNRGIGESTSAGTPTISDFVADAIAVLDAAGVEKAHVYGVSLGGVIVQQLALEHPDRVASLVVGCSGILSDDKPRAPKALNLLAYLPRRLLWALGRTSGYGSAATPDAIARNVEVLKQDKASRAGLVGQQDALRAYSVTAAQIAAGLTMPVLVLHGTEDTTVPLAYGEELHATVPHSQLITYAGAGHNYLVDAGDQPNADVIAFLAEVDG
jgi:pimeloyl-ACP methyl ester carboxylesterase